MSYNISFSGLLVFSHLKQSMANFEILLYGIIFLIQEGGNFGFCFQFHVYVLDAAAAAVGSACGLGKSTLAVLVVCSRPQPPCCCLEEEGPEEDKSQSYQLTSGLNEKVPSHSKLPILGREQKVVEKPRGTRTENLKFGRQYHPLITHSLFLRNGLLKNVICPE